ncbi:MAG: V-type ATP synthase subunit E family protein [Spirochaetia bacterium]|jgi:vacuolar-type H+-ATPase subunit E/Vma4|nr:V-type ATP synthase subunit E family protein [Spirochaetia bacterium]
MKTSSDDRSELITGITLDAKQEAKKIIEDAELIASDKKMSKEMQLKSIERDTAKKIEQQVSIMEKNSASAISVEKKRVVLKIREKVINNVIEKVREIIGEIGESKDYPEILRGWILEAAIGLDEEEAVVNGSVKDLEIMNETFLRETEKRYFDLTGGKIHLVKSEKNPLFAQGVVLTSRNNKTAFNNQVPTRLLRYQAEMRKTIHKEFFVQLETDRGSE